MKELEQILRLHAQRYPKMQPCDAVKLIYQNEFGGGHLIRDEEACLQYLRREYAGVQPDPRMPLQESIGNGMVRVNLAALPPSDLEALGQSFIRSASAHRGDMASFLAKLSVLQQLTEQGIFAFSGEELAQYLREYEKQGYPAVSHSQTYREHYHPAYRVILEKNT